MYNPHVLHWWVIWVQPLTLHFIFENIGFEGLLIHAHRHSDILLERVLSKNDINKHKICIIHMISKWPSVSYSPQGALAHSLCAPLQYLYLAVDSVSSFTEWPHRESFGVTQHILHPILFLGLRAKHSWTSSVKDEHKALGLESKWSKRSWEQCPNIIKKSRD